MLFLKSTSVTKAPGIYEVDIAAKPPGKTFGIFMATDPDNPPSALLAALEGLGYFYTHKQAYTHKDKGKVLDLHLQKKGSDLFNGWNVQIVRQRFQQHGARHGPDDVIGDDKGAARWKPLL